MWGLLSNKESTEKEPVPTTNAPPPMMFNPMAAGSTIKPRTSKNPLLARSKRPSGPGINQQQPQPQQQQPASPTGPLSPQSPVSPSTKSFNSFPNFQGAETHMSPPQQPVAGVYEKSSPQQEHANFDQYLTNYDYGNTPDVSETQNNKNIQENSNDYKNHDTGDFNQYGGGGGDEDCGTVSSFFGGSDDDGGYDYSAEVTHDQLQPEEALTESQNVQGDQQAEASSEIYASEEHFNYAYYQHYSQNPPPGQWDAYQQQWDEYYRSLDQNNLQCPAQEAVVVNDPQNDLYQAQTNQQLHQIDDHNVQQQYHTESQQQHEYNQNENSNHQYHQQRSQESLPTEESVHPNQPEHDFQQNEYQNFNHPVNEPKEEQPTSLQLHNNDGFVDQSYDQVSQQHPQQSYNSDNLVEERRREVSESSISHTFPYPTKDSSHHFTPLNPDSGSFQSAPQLSQHTDQPPVLQNQPPFSSESSNKNLSPFDYPQPSHDKHPSPVNPDNQYQQERDSTTPLWDKKGLNLPSSDDVDEQGNVITSPENCQFPPGYLSDINRSRNSSSTSKTVTSPPEHARTRTSSSKSQVSESFAESRSRTISSNSYKNDQVINQFVEPPPGWNQSDVHFSAKQHLEEQKPPPTIGSSSGSAFAPPIKTAVPLHPPTYKVNPNKPLVTDFFSSFGSSGGAAGKAFKLPNDNIIQPVPIKPTPQSLPNQQPPPTNQPYSSAEPTTRHEVFPQSSFLSSAISVPPPSAPEQRAHPPQNPGPPPPSHPPAQRPPPPHSIPKSLQRSHPPNFRNMPPPIRNALPNAAVNKPPSVPDSVEMPPPSHYQHINISKYDNNTTKKPNSQQHNSLLYTNMPVTFAHPIDANVMSRPSSRSSEGTIARLRQEYEERKILRRQTPDSVGTLSGDGIGSPLLNSTSASTAAKSVSMKSLRNSKTIQSAASIIAQQEAYENVVLQTRQTTYENHELLKPRKSAPVLPPKPAPYLPPRPSQKGASKDRPEVKSAQGSYGHRRNNSADSGNSFKSDSRSRYDDSRSERSRYDERDQDRGWNDRDRSRRDPRDYNRSYNDYDNYRRVEYERYRREELARRGYRPEDYYRSYDKYGDRGSARNYGYRQSGYDREQRYREGRYYHDRSDELSVSHTESVRSDPISNETEDRVDSTDHLKEATDTDPLLSSEESKSHLIEEEEDSVGIEEVSEPLEEEEEEPIMALADLSTDPYLYTCYHTRAQCFAPNRMVTIVAGDDDDTAPPPKLDITDFKLLYWQELKELEAYPGPFIKGETPKRDVMTYCRKQAQILRQSDGVDDGRVLLWDLLALMCRQNGVVIGTDVAELLLNDHQVSASKDSLDATESDVGFVIGSSGSSVMSYTSEEDEITEEQRKEAINKIRECLFEGQRKEALEVSAKYCLWDMALMIGTTLSSDIMSDTMRRFSKSLHRDDPLKSFHQLISNTEPSACSSVANWRQHLAMILSNQSDKYDPNFNCILNMANTLASKGMTHASHFCCLMGGTKLSSLLDKSSPIALLGFDHTKDDLQRIPYTAIQLTEIYEYAKLLGGEPCIVPYQAVKLFYAREVAKVGQYSKAIQYLQQISNNINFTPKTYRARFIQRVFDECMRILYILNPRMRELPEWTERLKEILNNRNLRISNRSTAYSSRVATPEIQRVAQYLLHKNTSVTAGSLSVAESLSAVSGPGSHVSSVAEVPEVVMQQAEVATAVQEPQQSQEAENNGFVFDGQFYRHSMYPGYVYYENEWYPDPNYNPTQQPSNQESQSSNQDLQDSTENVEHNQTIQPISDTSYQGDTTGYQGDTAGYQGDTTGYQGDTTGYQGDTTGYQGDNTGYQGDTTGYQGDTTGYQGDTTGYQGDTTGYQGGTEYNRSELQPPPSSEQADQQGTSDYHHGQDSAQPHHDSAQPHQDLTQPPQYSTSSRQRQNTLTNEEEEEEETDGAPAPLTFFNPATFGSNSLMAPIIPGVLPPSPEQPISDEEIKTPTNEGPPDDALDEVDEDSLYSKKKHKPSQDTLDGKWDDSKAAKASEGLFSRLFKRGNQKTMILPDDKQQTIYWDEKLGKYVDTTGGDEAEEIDEPPPPTLSLPSSTKSSISGTSLDTDKIMSAPSSPGGSLRRKVGRGRLANRYVDVMGSGLKKSATSPSFR